MGNDSNPVQLTASGTTVPGSVFLYCICVNKTLAGTMIVKDGAATLASFAIGTVPGTYHNLPSGGRYANLTVVLSGADDVTVYVRKVN